MPDTNPESYAIGFRAGLAFAINAANRCAAALLKDQEPATAATLAAFAIALGGADIQTRKNPELN